MKKKMAIGILITLIMISQASANMKALMDDTFNAMSNSTSARVYQTRSRVVMNGGSLSVHTSIVNPHVVSFVPPHLKGGCGGLDFFGGSLSFISADQFRELLRQVGSNSVGYLAEVALDSMCPTCVSAINTLQDRLQKMNKLLQDSCQTSKWLMNSTGLAEAANQIGKKVGQQANELAVKSGYLADAFTPTLPDKENGLDKLASHAETHLVLGNIIYQSLHSENVITWFPSVSTSKRNPLKTATDSTDKNTYELIQSITGTIVVEKEENAHTPKITVFKPTIGISELITGGNVQILACSNEDCSAISQSNRQIDGFEKIVVDLLLGSGSSLGIVDKITTPSTDYTVEEKKFITFDPLNIVSTIINIAKDSTLAREVARDASPIIAQALAVNLMYDVRKAVDHALSGKANHASSKAMGLLLTETYNTMYHELNEIQSRHTALISSLNNYRKLVGQMANSPKSVINATKG